MDRHAGQNLAKWISTVHILPERSHLICGQQVDATFVMCSRHGHEKGPDEPSWTGRCFVLLTSTRVVRGRDFSCVFHTRTEPPFKF